MVPWSRARCSRWDSASLCCAHLYFVLTTPPFYPFERLDPILCVDENGTFGKRKVFRVSRSDHVVSRVSVGPCLGTVYSAYALRLFTDGGPGSAGSLPGSLGDRR